MLKYLAFCEIEDYKHENRTVTPAASNVVRYMANVLSECDEVEIISPTRTLNTFGFYRGRRIRIDKKISLIHPPTFGTKTKLGSAISVLFVRCWLFLYLIIHLRQNETIIVYHSLAYMHTIKALKKLKKLNVVMEIREIYGDVKDAYKSEVGLSNRAKKQELLYFHIADEYIFPTEILNEIINKNKKPFVIATGIYKPEEIIEKRSTNGDIHVVFSGTLVPEKGSTLAIAAASYLPENYHIHILGYGNESLVNSVRLEIDRIRNTTNAKVSYDGLLYGYDYIRFLQRCHIGLATQDASAEYNDTSFPSKILTYLCNGLEVLSCNTRAITGSPVGPLLHYYFEQTPESVANAIMQIIPHTNDSNRKRINQLDSDLRKDIKELINSI